MLAILVIIFAIIGMFAAKIYAVHTIANMKISSFKEVVIDPKTFVATPLSSFFLYIKAKKNRNEYFPLFFSEMFGIILGVLSVLMLYDLKNYYALDRNEAIVVIASFGLSIAGLLYFSVFDILTLSIPAKFVKYIYLFTICTNLVVASVRLASQKFAEETIWDNVPLGNLDNVAVALIFWVGLYTLAKISKEQALGAGDADIAGIVGIMLGFPASVSALFFTLMVGGVVALIYAIGLSKIKNVLVPFVPIMTLGFTLAIGLSHIFIDLIFYGQI